MRSRYRESAAALARHRRIQRFIKGLFFRNLLVSVGTLLIASITLASALGPLFSDVNPNRLDWRNRIRSPSAQHPLGTDTYGRDMLITVLYAGRNSLSIALIVTFITAMLATAIGLAAPWFRSLDNLIMRIMDVFMSIPSMILAIALVGFLGASRLNVVIAIVVTQVPRFARVVRSSAITIRELTYVEAAKAIGAGGIRTLARHILPNCLAPIMVQATFLFAHAIIVESTLSFIGVGTPPPIPSWGNIMSEGRSYISSGWWLTVVPGIAISMSVLGLNILGDGLRDLLDPRLRGVR